MTDVRRQAVRLFEGMINPKNFALLPELFGPRFGEGPAFRSELRFGAPLRGAEAAERFFREVLFKVFPDLTYTVKEVVVDGSRAVVFAVGRGTHSDVYFGVPPTHRTVEYEEMLLFRFEDGKISDFKVVVERLAIMAQLGVLPSVIQYPGV